MTTCLITDLGLVSYTDASSLQQRLAAARKSGLIDDVFLLCEHPHVITLGRNANRQNLLASEHVLRQKAVELHATNRGGDVTYHGPGKTGIWVQAGASEEKLAAIGVHISRWVTSHGFAYNVSTDLRYFDLIVPCGIADRKA